MRFLTVLSGILLALEGAFIFSVKNYAFSSVAFPLGIGLLLIGLCFVFAYIASGKHHRVPDTVLVEGFVMFFYGCVVLNNEIPDTMTTIFFGSLLLISGSTRVSLSFDVSRYKPRDWAKILPLGFIGAIIGMLMMLPSLISSVSAPIIVGASFIINGLSVLIYAVNMEKRTSAERDAEARARAEAKRKALEDKRQEREELRSLSRKERAAYKKAQKEAEKRAAEEEKRRKKQEKEERRALRNPNLESTISFSKEDIAEIENKTEDFFEDNFKAIEDARKVLEKEQLERTMADLNAASAPAGAKRLAIPKPEGPVTLRKREEAPQAETVKDDNPKRAVKLDELEEKKPEISFDETYLPHIEKQAKGDERWNKEQYLAELERMTVKKEEVSVEYKPLNLEDLIGEEQPKAKINTPDDKSFTQKLTFNWNMNPDDFEK